MKGPRATAIGLGLFALVFGLSVVRLISMGSGAGAGSANGPIVIRIAHDNLHDSVRRAYRELIDEYERAHPGVRVETLEVPARVWMAWSRTQLTGGTAPDIMKIDFKVPEQDIAIFFEPLTEAMDEPNPYNQGTELADVRWRDTFTDGLNNPESFPPGLMEIYRVPFHGATARFFYNKDIFLAATGREEPPSDLDGFLAACAQIRAWGQRTGRPVYPLAAYDENGRLILSRLFAQQTQVVARQVSRRAALSIEAPEALIAYLRGHWAPDRAPVRDVWEHLQAVSREFQPAFLHTMREDAAFMFRQQRAAMIFSGSWDASYYLNDSPFRIGVAAMPLPEPEPRGREVHAYGPLAENNLTGAGGFGLVRGSAHRAQALDFLRFMTSQRVNEKYAAIVQRVPVIVGAGIDPTVEAFTPDPAGRSYGLPLDFSSLGGTGRWLQRLVITRVSELLAPGAEVAQFLNSFAPAFDQAIRQDARSFVGSSRKNIARTDSVITALAMIGHGGDSTSSTKASRMLENQRLLAAEVLQVEALVDADSKEAR